MAIECYTKYELAKKELIGKSAKFTNAQLSVSGGGANTQFRIMVDFKNKLQFSQVSGLVKKLRFILPQIIRQLIKSLMEISR